jgi:hypothetical protein
MDVIVQRVSPEQRRIVDIEARYPSLTLLRKSGMHAASSQESFLD